MALPTTPPITMQQILTEFRAPAGTPLTEFLKGGDYVPTNVIGGNIPTTLPIKFTDFLGATNPSAVVVSNVVATVGSISVSFTSAMDGEFTLTHATPATAITTATGTASATLTLRVDRATTPRVRLTVQGGNPIVGALRRAYTNVVFPQFDHPVYSATASGPQVADTQDSYRGSWVTTASSIPSIGTSEYQRVANALTLSNACVDGATFDVPFSFTHVFSGHIGNQAQFGQTISHSLGNSSVAYALAVLFLDDDGVTIRQEIPLNVIMRTRGTINVFVEEG